MMILRLGANRNIASDTGHTVGVLADAEDCEVHSMGCAGILDPDGAGVWYLFLMSTK